MRSETIRKVSGAWQQLTLGTMCVRGLASIRIGLRVQSDSETGKKAGIPYVMPENIHNNRIVESTLSQASNVSAQDCDRYALQSGDIVCSRRGDLTRHALIGAHAAGWLCGTGCLRLRFQPNSVDPLYAFYYLSHPDVCGWIKRHATGATMPHINKAILYNLPMAVPELSEQRRIAGLLSSLEEKIELNSEINRNLIAKARTLFQGIVKSWAPFKPLAETPHGWRLDSIQTLCHRIENGRTPVRIEPRYWNGNIPWLTSAEVRQPVVAFAENHITRAGLMESNLKIWPQGTTVIAMVGATAGQTAWLSMDSCANQACCGLVAPRELQLYLNVYMSSFAHILRRFAKGSAQQNINQQTIAKFPVLTPDTATLSTFDAEVRPLFERVASNLRESATLTALRDSILPELFASIMPEGSMSRPAFA